MTKRLLAALPLVLCLAAFARADGKYFGSVGIGQPPDIPRQRALIVWRDRVEILVIESAVDAESTDLSWVIPLPVKPEKIEKASPGIIESLEIMTGPEVQDRSPDFAPPILFLVATLILGFSFWFPKPSLARGLMVIFLWLLSGALLMPSLALASYGGGALSKAEVLEQIEVGSYDVSVLAPKTADGLGAWLRQSGFSPLDEKETKIIKDYINQGWCFVAARLQRKKGGYSQPHPLLFEFPAKQAIYPMKLTAAGSKRLALTLFVVGPRRASNPKMKATIASRLTMRPLPSGQQSDSASEFLRLGVHGLRGSCHTRLIELVRQREILTRLEADITPADMDEDYVLEFHGDEPVITRFYTTRARIREAGAAAFPYLLAAVVLAPIAAYWVGKKKKTKVLVWSAILLLGLAGGSVAGVLRYRSLPLWKGKLLRYTVWLSGVSDTLKELAARSAVSSAQTDREILEAVKTAAAKARSKEYYLDFVTNPLTGKERKLQESPGDWEIKRDEGKIELVIYDMYCRPYSTLLWPAKAKPPTTQPAGSAD